jgi:hypothetical protein
MSWNNMKNCVEPLTKLTIPPELQSAEAADGILSIELSDRPTFTTTFGRVHESKIVGCPRATANARTLFA